MSTMNSKSSRKKKDRASAEPAGARSRTALPEILPLPRRDDLLQIEGLEPATELALNSIGVRKFADFLGYTPETLAQALRERAGMAIAAATIIEQDWIGWAELLTVEAKNEESTAAAAADVSRPEEKFHETSPGEAEKISQIASAPLDIKPRAGAGANAPEAQIEKPEPRTRNESNGEVALSILQTRFSQREMPAAAKATAVKFLQGEIDCRVAGAKALRATTDHIALCTQILAVNTATGEHKMLASQLERFHPNQTDYRFYIEFAAPAIGRYQLQVVTFLLEVNPKIAFHRGPALRVTP